MEVQLYNTVTAKSMMKNLIFILLLTIGGSMGIGIFHHCEIHRCESLMPHNIMSKLDGMPPNAEDLKEICPPLFEVMECYSGLIVECTGQTFEELAAGNNETVAKLAGFFSNLMKLNYDVCNEETQLHKKEEFEITGLKYIDYAYTKFAVVGKNQFCVTKSKQFYLLQPVAKKVVKKFSNLRALLMHYIESIPCFREMVKNPDASCRRDADRLYGAYREALTEADEEGTLEEVIAESNCMTTAYDMACTLKKVQKSCSDVAKDVILEVLKRLKVLKLGFCSEADFVTLKTKFVNFLEEQGEERDFLLSAFDYRKKK